MIITNFTQSTDAGGDFEDNMPDHTLEALDHYFLKGWKPGGFLSALIAQDYQRALAAADQANKQRFWFVATWLMRHAPEGSTGSYEVLENWCDDKDGIQSNHKDEAEKAFEWRTLLGETIT